MFYDKDIDILIDISTNRDNNVSFYLINLISRGTFAAVH